MDQRAAFFAAAGDDRRERGETAHAEHDLRFVFPDERACGVHAFEGAGEERDHLRRPRLRHREERQAFEVEIRVAGGSEAVDFLLADEQRHIMAARGEHFADGDAGKQMTARATARDEDMETLFRSLRHGASELRGPAVVVPDIGQISTREVDSLAMDVDEDSDCDHGCDEARATVADKWQRQALCFAAE